MADDSAGLERGPARPADPLRPIAPTIGTVAAGLTLAVLFVPGTGTDTTVQSLPLATLGRVAAVGALLAFVLARRVDIPERAVGALVVAAGLVVASADLLTLFGELNVWRQPAGLPLATAGAISVVGMGAAMALSLPDRRVFSVTKAISLMTAVGGLGFFVSIVGGNILVVPFLIALDTTATSVTYPLLTVAVALATFVFVAATLRWLGADRSWIDLSVPSLRGLGLVVAGLLVLILALNVLTALISELGLPAVESGVEQQARQSDNPEFLLVLAPLSFLAIAPSEELLYRGLVQKYLYDTLGKVGAVVAASAIFAAIHFGQYASPDPLQMLVSLSVVFVLSLVLGYSYARSENLVVPILIHGTYNALTFLAMYARVTGMVPTG
ncbi:CPBP family intramembrane glutamic endopeptidase [Salinibaculum rarum]|uniref:CPBP family intramembrane glutamic endopeptidase n=1 Tax=Salinibaculum rarum TaxID=3058903 RepID=UPI00265E1355|nr:CPBP family glutamic-type intramembrane protease [Salinibaculum sp. KK48]